jgi:D-3-phosphoglycerate dehydrogenase
MKIGLVGSIHELGWEVLRSQGHSIIEVTDVSTSNLKKELADVSGIVLRTAQMPNEVIDACPDLQIIARHGVGYDNVDLNYLNKKKIALGVTGTANAVSVAEHVMTFFLQLTKNIHLADELTRKGKFQEKGNLPSFFELYQKNVLILGFGRIGQAVAKRCLGFEMNVFVYDPYVDEEKINSLGGKKVNDLKEAVRDMDAISLHIPLNNETKNLINFDLLKTMRKNCIIINAARGGIINEIELDQALKENLIFGAGLDVFETEPPKSDNPLLKNDKVFLSPHTAAFTEECMIRMGKETIQNIIDFFEKKLDNSKIVKL